MNPLSLFPERMTLDEFIKQQLPGARVIENVVINIDPGCIILLADPRAPRERGTTKIAIGTHEARVIQTPPGNQSERWIVLTELATHDEGPAVRTLLGRPIGQWRELARLRDDFDLLDSSGKDYF